MIIYRLYKRSLGILIPHTLALPPYGLVSVSWKVLAHDVVTLRMARSGDFAPMEISVQKPIVNAMKLMKR